jgi:hypothetical protein
MSMPLGDRTGPLGLGPRTGRGLGYCAGYGVPGYLNPIGRGFGYGRGFGFGRFWLWTWLWRWGFRYAQAFGYPYRYGYTQVDEKAVLSAQAKALEEELNAIKARLAELEKQTEK